MRSMLMVSFVFVVIPLVAQAAPPATQPGSTAPSDSAAAAYRDMEQTLGLVPGFMRAYPSNAIAGAWEEFKTVQLSADSAIPPKYKELIGLAVAAQVPCHYCTYAHTEFAKLHGATEDEIKQVVAEAALTRHWSTWINGIQPDEATFRAEFTRAADAMKKQAARPSGPAVEAPITDARSAFADMERTLGVVPTFMRALPEKVVPSAWRALKSVEFAEGPVPPKYLSLASLAVASQVPCRYCVIADSEMARAGGATEMERKEAILMAAMTRHWSTYLNGVRYDENKFRRDVDQMVSIARKNMAKTSAR